MPESWVRAAMLVRANSLAQGASGVRYATISAILALLQRDIIPVIPLRGSISASGDLSPLAYIAGVLEGNPSLYVWMKSNSDGQRQVERADTALAENSITPLTLGAREALALVNGTSISAAVAALASHEALLLASLAQLLTAMSVEGLRGTDESFLPFFSQVCPHDGQAECAANILSFLTGSSLVARDHSFTKATLRQDRYSIRTAAQWLGPCVEDILLAHAQISVELNSATDNPLIGTSPSHKDTPKVLHGGNFQAKAVTSAVEKIRQAAQSIGRMLFTQCTELINPATSRGLPPNLVITEPSRNFIFKGTDILIAALLSELGFLANPVGTHVQTAEMGNQALNSLAFISARYTIDALDVLAQLAAAHLVAVCQALDLRAFHHQFIRRLKSLFHELFDQGIDWQSLLLGAAARETLKKRCWISLVDFLEASTSLDSDARISGAVMNLQPLLLGALPACSETIRGLRSFTQDFSQQATRLYGDVRDEYVTHGSAEALLGHGTRRLYNYVRLKLRVPFVGPETLTAPGEESGGRRVTMGDLNGRVRRSMTEGGLYGTVVDCLRDANPGNETFEKARYVDVKDAVRGQPRRCTSKL
ncbi:MAG: hypothetical protein Q9225_000743 [Loekoesia sp. 1 TL-2023]